MRSIPIAVQRLAQALGTGDGKEGRIRYYQAMPGFHHYGRIVSHLGRSIEFYRDTLGLHEVVQEDLVGAELDAQVEIVGADVRTAMLMFPPDGPMLELIAYREPLSRPRQNVAPNDVGNDHPCALVEDIHAEYERLTAAGVRFSCAPQRVGEGFFEGDWVTFCFDPDGLTVELWESTRS